MNHIYYQQLKTLFKRIAAVYLLYFLCRILFFVGNVNYFEGVGVWRLLINCFYGLRFDSFSIAVSNSLFILLSLFPWRMFWTKTYQNILKIIFITTNSLFIAANCIDVGYYPFIKKRATSELFDQIGGQSDLSKLLPKFIADFWWIFMAFILFIYVLIKVYSKIKTDCSYYHTTTKAKSRIYHWLLFALLCGLTVLAIRGGLQRVPIDIVNAGSITKPEEVPLVLNTPFTIIKSMSQKAVPAYSFYSESELLEMYNPIKQYNHDTFRKENVVVLILESFSKEYTRLGKTTSITPFFDSLMNHSLVFSNGFSNGTKSIEGIPAILSSFPSLMPNPLINSMYANNLQTSLPSLLKPEGYETAFFHGGINGTMNFNDWAALAGYDHYFGKNEYGNDLDFDGFWGIFDEPFLQFSVEKMNKFKQPFHAAIFTLSSHHPYLIPDKHKDRFPKTVLENSESIGYGDYSLRLFFESAKKTNWYHNTVFVLVADHTGVSEHPFYKQLVGMVSIPIVFYKPDNSLAGVFPNVFSQIDILPSVMDYLGYSTPFFSFGSSFHEKQQGHDYLYANGTHFLLGDSTLHSFNANQIVGSYNYLRDSTLSRNLKEKNLKLDSAALRDFKAFIQTYHQTLIHNSARIKN